MLLYLINATAIWLLSLLFYDLLLKNTSYHGYNRLYLLLSFAMGCILPMLEWPADNTADSPVIHYAAPAIHSANNVRMTIDKSEPVSALLSMERTLWTLYIAGVVIATLLTLKEFLVLTKTYKKGNRSKDGVWTIVETGKEHSPYSAFRYVFLSSKKGYTTEQLRIILNHEEQHGHLLHFFDILFMQMAKVAFWFHPLAYMYAERISIVHEYQADAAASESPGEYGRFLIEQSILQSAPALSHSFNRSPIKKRILMLTHHSPSTSRLKTLVAIPLVIVCILCFSKNAFSDDTRVKKGNIVTYRGNTIEFEAQKNYTRHYNST